MASIAGITFIIILAILFGASIYLLYWNLPGEPEEFTFAGDGEVDTIEVTNFSNSQQFYDNLRFRDKRISYRIEPVCGIKKTSEVEEAFSILESKTILDLYPAEFDKGRPEVIVFCSEIGPEPEKEGYFVAGEGGPTEVINTSLYGVILAGKVSFFRNEKCEKPNIALHEILHVLGFDHNNNPDSILYPTLDCKQEIDDSIIRDINRLYAVESAPDLKIVDVSAIKSGRYLNFEIEVINQGLQNAGDVSLRVYADDKLAKEFDLEIIEIGTRKFLTVENLKVARNSKKIVFILDEENKINEIFEGNNMIELVLKSES